MNDLSILAAHEPHILHTWCAIVPDSLENFTPVLWLAMEDAHRFALRNIDRFAPGVSLRETPGAAWVVIFKRRSSGRHQLLCAAHFVADQQQQVTALVHQCVTPLYPEQAGAMAEAVLAIVTDLYGVSFTPLTDWPETSAEQKALQEVLLAG